MVFVPHLLIKLSFKWLSLLIHRQARNIGANKSKAKIECKDPEQIALDTAF